MSDANRLTNQIINHVYSAGGFAWRAASQGVFDARRGAYRTAPKKGVSDVLACWKGRMVAIEVKIGLDRLRPEQEGFLKNIEAAGGVSFVAKDFPSFVEFFGHLTSSQGDLKL